jgi:hypothetical protein
MNGTKNNMWFLNSLHITLKQKLLCPLTVIMDVECIIGFFRRLSIDYSIIAAIDIEEKKVLCE